MLKDAKKLSREMLKQAIKTNDMELMDYIFSKDDYLAIDRFDKSLYWPIHLACEYGRL